MTDAPDNKPRDLAEEAARDTQAAIKEGKRIAEVVDRLFGTTPRKPDAVKE